MNKILIKDNGWNKLILSLSTYKNAYTKVGYPMGISNVVAVHGGSSLTVGEIAGVMELGSVKMRIPARPTLEPAFKKNLDNNLAIKEKLGKQWVSGSITMERALAIIGEVHVGQIVSEINKLTNPPLSIRALKRRRAMGYLSEKPLIETAQMKTSVTHVEVIE